MFDNIRDADMRLSNSFVRYDGVPVFVQGVHDMNQLDVFFPKEKNTKVMDWNDPKFDFSSVPLGYVNTERGAIYSFRQPHRKYKQGVSKDCFRLQGKSSTGDVFNDQGMYDCIAGVYPSFADTIAQVTANGGGRAYHRHWMLFRNAEGEISIQHRGIKVGVVKNGVPILLKDKRYLAECLEESLK